MDPNSAIAVVERFLLERLKHTGDSGFEGLVAILVQEATGLEFRLASSGRQYGRDAASEGGPARSIKVEAKHYHDASLDLPRLLSKVDEAATSDPNLDMWILAASCSVSDQIEQSLTSQAENHGVDVVILDLGINGLPRLVVLMARYAGIFDQWAQRHGIACDRADLANALSGIAAAPDFQTTLDRLLERLNGLSGYGVARKLVRTRLLSALSDRANARGAFKQNLSIKAQNTQIVCRTQLYAMFDNWWERSDQPPAVVLGEEGTGKTWAVFDWAVGRFGQSDSPILLPLTSQQFNSADTVDTLIPRLLHRWTGLLDEPKWKRRLHKWAAASPSKRPLIVLIMDGLNERASSDWRPFLSEILGDPWRGMISLLITDRPHHWRTKCAKAGLTAFHEIAVQAYTESELEQALWGIQLPRRDTPPDLLQLISIPRYCRLVAEHYQEMIASDDFTKERLIYLEIRDRGRSKVLYPLTDDELRETICTLSRRALDNPDLRASDVRSLITAPGGDEATIYEELVSGGLLVPVPGLTERYRIDPLRLVYGFGLLLASELSDRSSSSAVEIEEFLNSWFEPQPDMDRKVEICGAAMFHALFESAFPETPLRELIRYWLGLRNWADTAQTAFTTCMLRNPRVFLALAEAFWSEEEDSGSAQELLGLALVAHRNNPKVQPMLIDAIERWMGFIHPLGRHYWKFDAVRDQQMRAVVTAHTGQPLIGLTDEAGRAERTKLEIESRAGRQLTEGEIEIAGYRLTVVADGALLRLARFGLLLMSAGDPAPFLPALVRWALASAVMDDSGFGDLVSWVIRLADVESDAFLTLHARQLLSRSEQVAREAARFLLVYAGTRQTESFIDQHDLTPDWYKDRIAEHRKDPCLSFYPWTQSECLACLSRPDVPLHMLLPKVSILVADPAVRLPDALVRRTEEALSSVDPMMIRAATGGTVEDHNLEIATPLLGAHSPAKLADFMRRVLKTLPDRPLNGQYALAIKLPQLSLLLNEDTVATVLKCIAGLSEDVSEWQLIDQKGPLRQKQIAEAYAFAAIAPHLAPAELWTRFLARSPNTWDLIQLDQWFAPVSDDAKTETLQMFRNTSDPTALFRIMRGLPSIGVSFSDGDRARILELAESPNAGLRAYAARLAVLTNDEILARRIVELGKCATKDIEPREEHWLTLVLGRFGRDLPFEEIARRLRPSAIGFAIRERGNQPDEIEMYADCVEEEIQQIMRALEPSIHSLPRVELTSDPSDVGALVPELWEPSSQRTVHLGRSNSWTSGKPTDQVAELQKIFSGDGDDAAQQATLDRRNRIASIREAWRTDAFRWYGRGFDRKTVDLLCRRHRQRVDSWLQAALAESASGAALRVRLGSFLEPVCRALLSQDSPTGLQLWKLLRKREDNPIVFNTCDIAFDADDNPSSQQARRIAFDDCWSDAAIARLSFAAHKHARTAWLDNIIKESIAAPQLWRKAKGLTLASFSDVTEDDFEALVANAGIEGTWVVKDIALLQENVRQNRLARHWYSVFLNAHAADEGWSALQLVFCLGDERLLNWRKEIEENAGSRDILRERLRFLGLGWNSGGRELWKELDRNDKRKSRLFGIEIKQGEIYPFMEGSAYPM